MMRYRLKNKIKINVYIASVFILILIIVGIIIFNNDKDIKKQDPVEENKNEVLQLEEEKEVEIIDLDSSSRNIAIMINNINTVWGYQSGINDAYIVYEIIVEGGYTRLMAIYKDKLTSRIGSVRSARPYYLDYVLENDAIYVHFGGSDQALSEVNTLNIDNIDFLSSTSYWRDKSLGLATEHTAYTSIEKIEEQITKNKYRNTILDTSLLNYSINEVDLSKLENSKVANRVHITYSNARNTSFEYDSENKVYKRYQNDKEHTDYVTKEQYTAKNIITYKVENYSLDSYGRQALKNIGSGDGYYISNGYAVEITWEKPSRDAKTIYRYKNGEEINVNDGNTYIEIQPKNKKLVIE